MSASNSMTAAEFGHGLRVITARELAAYFDSTIAYVYTIAFLLLSHSIFMNDFFLAGVVDMSGYFELLPLLLVFFVPAVTMRLWAEERKHRTAELLLTLPVTPIQAVLGKYLAALTLYGLFLAGSLPIVVMLLALGDPDLGLIFSGYLGLFLFGSLFLAFGEFFSSLTSEQIVAFVAATLLGCILLLTGNAGVVAVLDGLWPSFALGTLLYESVSVMPHYEAFVRGAVRLDSLAYFFGCSAVFLWMNAFVLERDRG